MSQFSSPSSKSNPSECSALSIAASMVWSNFGLSCFHHALDRNNCDTVCALLTDLTFKIVAVWVVSRPVNGYTNSRFEHWCVKIQAPPSLLSIDFLESNKKGAFGLQQRTAMDAELQDFLHYYVREENGRKRKKWRIISSVTPSPLSNTSYLKYIDDHEVRKLKSFMIKSNNKRKSNAEELVKHIDINRKVCDIADFLSMWTESQRNDEKEVGYNAITRNCQQFAADLFHYLVGHKKQYQMKVQEVRAGVQSPYDIKQYKVNQNNQQKNDKSSKKLKEANWYSFSYDYINNQLQLLLEDDSKIKQVQATDDEKKEDEQNNDENVIDEIKEEEKEEAVDVELIDDMLVTEESDILIARFNHKDKTTLNTKLKDALYCAVVLCGYYLYLLPIQIYQRWKQFERNTKINDIIKEFEWELDRDKDDNHILNEECTRKMIQNLCMNINMNENDIYYAMNIISGKTKLELEQYLLSIKDKTMTLQEIFKLKSIPSDNVDTKRKLFEQSIKSIERIDIRYYDKIIPFNLSLKKYFYGLMLKSDGSDQLLFRFKSNNQRFEMMTHFDYSMNYLAQPDFFNADYEPKTQKTDIEQALNNKSRTERYKECSKYFCWYSSKLMEYMTLHQQNENAVQFSVDGILECYKHCMENQHRIQPNQCTNDGLQHNDDSKEQPKGCIYYKRNYRDRDTERREEFYDRNTFRDDRDAARVQILDSIHCYLFHSQEKNIKNKKKFINDFENLDEKEEQLKAKKRRNKIFRVPTSCRPDEDDLANNENIINREEHERLFGDKKRKNEIFRVPKSSRPDEEDIGNNENIINKEEHEKLFGDKKNDDEEKKNDILNNFGFGVNLSYWHKNNEWNDVVIPKYSSLKLELTQNMIYRLSKQQYYDTYNKAKLWNKIIRVKAKNVAQSKTYNILSDEKISINHIISLMVYCNYTQMQYEFKKYCRPYDNEEASKFMKRNTEIAHWSRYLYESCSIYGKKMNDTDILYTGLKSKLLFSSWTTYFYCPLSTTPNLEVAQRFADPENGIIIKLQKGNDFTRNFNVSYLSDYPQEKERLIVGQSLKITDIICTQYCKDNYTFISLSKKILSLHLLENILNGLFVVCNKELMDKQVHKNLIFLIKNHLIADVGQKQNKLTAEQNYLQQIFNNMIHTKLANDDKKGKTWLNELELKVCNKKLSSYFYDIKQQQFGALLNNFKKIYWVQQYKWTIEGDQFIQLTNDSNQMIYSKVCKCYIDGNKPNKYNDNNRESISIYFGCRGGHSVEQRQCVLYMYIKSVKCNKSVKSILIGYDRLCKQCNYHNYMHPNWIKVNSLNNANNKKISSLHCGGKTFNIEKLTKLSYITWTLGIKVIEIKYQK